jgi:cbb3-type cytochrome oxidase subunit 3
MEVIALEQRQLAEIFLIVLTIFFVLWWLLAYQFRVPG